MFSFFAFYVVHPFHTVVAVVAGSLLHVTLKALFLKAKARIEAM